MTDPEGPCDRMSGRCRPRTGPTCSGVPDGRRCDERPPEPNGFRAGQRDETGEGDVAGVPSGGGRRPRRCSGADGGQAARSSSPRCTSSPVNERAFNARLECLPDDGGGLPHLGRERDLLGDPGRLAAFLVRGPVIRQVQGPVDHHPHRGGDHGQMHGDLAQPDPIDRPGVLADGPGTAGRGLRPPARPRPAPPSSTRARNPPLISWVDRSR